MKWTDRLHHDMNMIWHHYPSEQIVSPANVLSVQQRFDENGGNSRVF
jgi:hypothetical protein